MSQGYTFNMPPIGPRQGKVWGITQLIFAFNGTEAHALTINKGGFCSRHYHRSKWNRFMLLEGVLKVSLFRDNDGIREDDGVDETVLLPGQVTDVPPEVSHEFEALEDCKAVEIYWTVLEAGDIERDEDQLGGMRDAS